MTVIEAVDVIFDYPQTRALDGVSFTIPAGGVTALVGPNGAGKSTLMRLLAGLEAPLSGHIRIDGVDTAEDPRGVHSRVGYLSDFFGLYDQLTVEQALLFAARSRGTPRAEAMERARIVAERVGLSERLTRKVGALSRGMRQRLGVAQTIIHAPKLALLDEPSSGLDPEARRRLSQLIRTLRDEGMTLIVSSHILSELEDYSDRMIMIESGRVRFEGPLLGPEGARTRVLVRLAAPWPGLRALLESRGVEVERVDELEALALLPGGAEQQAALLRGLIEAGAPIAAFAPHARALRDAYFAPAAVAEVEPLLARA